MKRLALLLLLLPATLLADERILEFHSDITVMEDGWIEVTETIRVRAEGNRIRRGIYRDFPTEYHDKLGNRYEVDFKPLIVLRNDAREPFHSQRYRNGVRTYFGSSDRYIERGVHTYRFRYRASRMLGFFEDHDELYWNVTGFDWAFPIDKGSASLRFAFEVPAGDIDVTAYTGPYGSTEQNYTAHVDANAVAHFEANEALGALNGLTIVVMWPKGLVPEPTDLQRAGWLLKDNLHLRIVLLGFAGVLYGLVTGGLGFVFLYCAVRVYLVRNGQEGDRAARQMFTFSILYLFLIFAVLLAEQGLGAGAGWTWSSLWTI